MLLRDLARQYCEKNGFRLTPLHGANRFVRLTTVDTADAVTTDHFAAFRTAAVAKRLSPWTIEKTITDVITIVALATGKTLDAGKRLRRPRPQPEPAPIEAVDAAFQNCEYWTQQWIAISYWTGLRLADSLRLQQQLVSQDSAGEVLRLQANKTGHLHCWPRPEWLNNWLRVVPLPYPKCKINAAKVARFALRAACIAAKVRIIVPKQLRQRSVTEWSRVNGMAGSIIHGSGLRVMTHYVDPITVLDAAAPAVRIPAAFGAQDRSDDLVGVIRRLDPDARRIISDTARRLASG